jgi:hypothetical protein
MEMVASMIGSLCVGAVAHPDRGQIEGRGAGIQLQATEQLLTTTPYEYETLMK